MYARGREKVTARLQHAAGWRRHVVEPAPRVPEPVRDNADGQAGRR